MGRKDGRPRGEILAVSGEFQWPPAGRFSWPPSKEFILSQIPGVDTQSPAFRSARSAWGHLLPSNGPNTQRATEQAMTQLLQTSRCMRAHGVTDFPDPTASPPSNQAAYFDVAGFGGPNSAPGAPPVAYLAIPNSINPNSPATKRAATACHWRLQ